MDKLIYLDNAATTKTSPEVVEAMLPYFTEHYGNPSSVYAFAAANKEVIIKTKRDDRRCDRSKGQMRFILRRVDRNLTTGH